MTPDHDASEAGPPPPRRRPAPRLPGQVVTCGWCGTTVTIPARGRIPKWCSPTCRHRAWEQARAAASGRSAVHVVEHTVERVVQARDVREVPVKVTPKRADQWVEMLDQLAQRLDAGLLYSRDLPTLRPAMERLVAAYNRREDEPR